MTNNDAVIRRGTAEGVIFFMVSEPIEGHPRCSCCPEKEGHIYARGVEFGPFDDVYPEHFGHGVRELLGSVALCDNTYEGKRVRVTIEVME